MSDSEKVSLILNIISRFYEYLPANEENEKGAMALLDAIAVIAEFGCDKDG